MNRSGEKFEQIVNKSKELFWKHGFKRVSIEEICRKSEVSKMTFYKHFSNKIELVKYILDNLYDKAMDNYRSFMDSDIPFTEKVEKSIQLKMSSTQEMSDEFIHDYMQADNEELIIHLNKRREEQLQMLLDDYLKAQKRGDIRKDVKPEFILFFINHMFEMAKNPQLEELYDHTQDLIMELTRFFFYGIMGSEKEDK